MLSKRKGKERNLLTLVPLLPDHVRLGENCLLVERNNWAEKFSIRFLKQPSIRTIKLDKFGAFVVERIAEQKNVEEIMASLQEHFGEEAEPALPRLKKFLEILEVNEWLMWK